MSTLPSSHVLEQKSMEACDSDPCGSIHVCVQEGSLMITCAIGPGKWNTGCVLSLVIKKEAQDSYHEHQLSCSALKVYKRQETGNKGKLILGTNLGKACLVGRALKSVPQWLIPKVTSQSMAPWYPPWHFRDWCGSTDSHWVSGILMSHRHGACASPNDSLFNPFHLLKFHFMEGQIVYTSNVICCARGLSMEYFKWMLQNIL